MCNIFISLKFLLFFIPNITSRSMGDSCINHRIGLTRISRVNNNSLGYLVAEDTNSICFRIVIRDRDGSVGH